MAHPAIAPRDLALPAYVRSRLHHRDRYVLAHGFDSRTVGVDWWNRRLRAHGLNQRVQVFDHGDAACLTRGDLFQLGSQACGPEASEDQVLTFLWHVLAWGTDQSQRGNLKRIQAFMGEADRRQHTHLLAEALTLAREGDAPSAYRALIRRGGGRVSGLGPAFFTKLLYFASEDCPGTRCLILDARVAGALAQAGWESLPWSPRNGYSYNWYTDTYASYCALLQRWANEESDAHSGRVWPDEIERSLFEGNRHPVV